MKNITTEKPNIQVIRNNKRFIYASIITFFILSLTILSGIHRSSTNSSYYTTIDSNNNINNINNNNNQKETTWFKNTLASYLINDENKNNNNHHHQHHVISNNNYNKKDDHVLIVTPLKNASPYLSKYFELVDQLDYPKDKITMAFLVSDTTDDTIAQLKNQQRKWKNKYHHFHIYEKDFRFELPEDQRHQFHLQPLRRSFMARSRNFLLSLALKQEHQWVLWLDVDVVQYSPTILKDLMSVDVDVIVPNCLRLTEDGSFWGYDKNNWQETETSLNMQKELDPDYVLLEGYNEFVTNRYLMVDMPTHLGQLNKVPLDGVGATFTLVKAEVHREGANFPAFTFQHQVETEGFAKMAKAMGFGVYGLPGYLIYHVMNS